MKILVIGVGVMGSGLASVLSKENEIFLYDHDVSKAENLAKKIGAQAFRSIETALDFVEMILLCVKPKDLKNISEVLKGKVHKNQVLVSILSAISQDRLKSYFEGTAILRMMPNTPCFFGAGLAALANDPEIPENKKAIYQNIFSPLGQVLWIEESEFDAFTALAGSGPAFAFVVIESMIDAGIALGLSKEKARDISLQMVHGAIVTMQETGRHPGELKWEVTSPGGCTIAGIQAMEDRSVRSGLIQTFLATYAHLNDKNHP